MRWPWEKQIDRCYKAQKKLYCGLWEITNIKLYYYQLPGPFWNQHGEKTRKVHRVLDVNTNNKEYIACVVLPFSMIDGNYNIYLSVLIQEEGKESSHCAICWDNVNSNSIHCLLFIFSLDCGLTVKYIGLG